MQHVPKVPNKLLTAVGKLLSLARKQRKWRQFDLAQRLQTTRQTIARMEQGDAAVSAGIYFSAAWILDVPILAGMDSTNTKTQAVMTDLITLLQHTLPKRVVTPKEKPIDDNF